MLNIVMPIAGRGSRFLKEGYATPKPMISIHNKPMIQIVINNIRPAIKHQFIFICLKEHIIKNRINELLEKCAPNCIIEQIDDVSEGAACTVLLSKKYINNDHPLMIANCDQWVDLDINDYITTLDKTGSDGLIMTMWADDPKWSFVRFNTNGNVCEVVEKQVVSNEATVGIYNYRLGSDFVSAAEAMIAKNLRVNNEFYVAPAYNEMIGKGKKVVIYNVGKEFDGMYGLGIPSDLKKFESLDISRKAVAF
jgi:NDP-sugar pyrophosphorylase family protein